MKRWMLVGIVTLLLLATALTACARTPNVTWELRVTGAVASPVTYSYSDLAGRDQTKLGDVVLERSEGDPSSSDWEGIALADLLLEAGASAGASAAVFRAADGYEREIDMADLGEAIIALKENGNWLAEDERTGPIRIVIPGLPGSRWVGQLTEIEVLE